MRPRLFLAICLAGCAVTEQEYPAAWGPLPAARAADCARFAGSYADRGETTAEGSLRVTAWDESKPLFTRTLTEQAGEFECKEGELVVRSRRWVAADVVAGREDVTIEFSQAKSSLVAHVRESTYGALFAVVPIAGTASHWYRFARLSR
jgi:hypothetical protein